MSARINSLALPRRKRGRQSAEAAAHYDAELQAWCAGILEIASALDFKVSSRGWCYILEDHGLSKTDFDVAQALINACRKSGLLPLDFCAEDERRTAEHIEEIDEPDPAQAAADIVEYVRHSHHRSYQPISFWEGRDVYVQMAVEKIDLKSLYSDHCGRFRIPLTNIAGWADLHSRAAMMKRFAYWEARGAQCVLLYCGDHDPGGLNISNFIRSNLADMSRAVGWSPDDLIIDRFGLNADFIDANGLTWIDNLSTAAGEYPLDDPNHRDHPKPYVQNYLRNFGARKCEANSLVVRPEAGRELCLQAILKYLPETAPEEFERRLDLAREEMREEIERLIGEAAE